MVLHYIMKYGSLLECTNNYSMIVDKEFDGIVLPYGIWNSFEMHAPLLKIVNTNTVRVAYYEPT